MGCMMWRGEFEHTKVYRRTVLGCSMREVSAACVTGWVLLSACAFAAVTAILSPNFGVGGLGERFVKGLPSLVLEAVLTGVVEELLFRGIVLFALLWGLGAVLGRRGFVAQAVWAQAVLFGVLHVSGELGPQLAAQLASQPWEWGAVVCAQALLKVLQGTLFGVCMAALLLARGSLFLPAFVHLVFDMIYFAPFVALHGAFPSLYLTGSVAELVPLLVAVAVLVPPAIEVAKALRQRDFVRRAGQAELREDGRRNGETCR